MAKVVAKAAPARAAASADASWEARLLAAIALEHVLWRDGLARGELAARITRRAYLHERIARARNANELARARAPLLRAPCRIAVARYAIAPEDVVARIVEEVDVAQGLRHAEESRHAMAAGEPQRSLDALPEYERRIVALLAANDRTYWIAKRTSSKLHALVEHPEGSVVLTVKPPGSEIEIEIKRTGSRASRPLDVHAYDRDGIAPLSHHLWGGAQADLLRWERGESNLLSLAYRIVHGRDASMSRTLSITSVFDLPNGANVLAFFAERDAYGDGFEAMQERMRVVLKHFGLDDTPAPPHILATRFLGRVHPAQAIQIGTSSFRLHRVAELLAHPGSYDTADEILEECIPLYAPPPRRGGFTAYVRAAFRANRDAAQRAYVDCASQLGEMHGTVAGLRAGSSGESFAPRNIGLRCVLEDGAWRVRLAFMDHDSLNICGRDNRDYHPRPLAKYLAFDVKHVAHSLRMLGSIYPFARREAHDAFRHAASDAYRKTVHAVATDPRFRPLFHDSFRKRVRDWDTIVARAVTRDAASWKEWLKKYLRGKKYPAHLVEEYLVMIPPFRRFWRRAAFRNAGIPAG